MVGRRGEGYVIIQFFLFAGIALAPLISRMPLPPVLRSAGWVLVAVGLALSLWSLAALGRNLTPLPHPVEGNRLVQHGPYRLARHPIYTSLLTVSLGYAIAMASPLAFAGLLLLLALFDAKTRREEAWLLEKHPEYRDYQRRTKKLLPWVY